MLSPKPLWCGRRLAFGWPVIAPPNPLTTTLPAALLARAPALASNSKNASHSKIDPGVTDALAQGEATQQVIAIAPVIANNIVWDAAKIRGSNIVWSDRVIGRMDGDAIIWGDAPNRRGARL
jgi:hypothetical protein